MKKLLIGLLYALSILIITASALTIFACLLCFVHGHFLAILPTVLCGGVLYAAAGFADAVDRRRG